MIQWLNYQIKRLKVHYLGLLRLQRLKSFQIGRFEECYLLKGLRVEVGELEVVQPLLSVTFHRPTNPFNCFDIPMRLSKY